MSVNSSSSLNITLPPSDPLFLSLYTECQDSVASLVLYNLFVCINILLLPLYVFVLYMGFQQRRRQSHSDVFTYHNIAVEIFGVLGSLLYIVSSSVKGTALSKLGVTVFSVTFPGQTLFHLLTCVERYLAVVHPVTYMRLRDTSGVAIRNVSIASAWLVSFGFMGVTVWRFPDFPLEVFLCLLSVSALVILFCCFSVLRLLTRPGPGEVGGATGHVDQSKRRAFNIIRVIVVALLIRFMGLMISFGLSRVESLPVNHRCAMMDAGLLVTLPSNLVLPLLFLHRAGKLACCRSRESG